MKRILAIGFFLQVPLFCFANSICYLGDSQSSAKGALFSELIGTLKQHGSIDNGLAVCDSTIDNFMYNPKKGTCKDGKKDKNGNYSPITNLVISNSDITFPSGAGETKNVNDVCGKSDLVILQFGDNYLRDPDKAASDAEEIVREIMNKGRRCIWIGPASIGKKKGEEDPCLRQRGQKKSVSTAIENKLKSTYVNGKTCTYINSFKATSGNPPPGLDPACKHYFIRHYSIWAQAIKSDLENALDGKLIGTSPQVQILPTKGPAR